jgi:hypothetical protein
MATDNGYKRIRKFLEIPKNREFESEISKTRGKCNNPRMRPSKIKCNTFKLCRYSKDILLFFNLCLVY